MNMQNKVKRRALIAALSFLGGIISGVLLRTVYESFGLPDVDVHDKYYTITGIVADLVSSFIGLIVWKSSSNFLRRRGYLQDHRLDLDVQTISNSVIPRSSWSRINSHLITAGKIIGGAAVVIGAGSATKGIYEALDGPNVNVKAGPFVLDGAVSDIISTGTAIALYEGADPTYRKIVEPMLNKLGCFKEKPAATAEDSKLMLNSLVQQYDSL